MAIFKCKQFSIEQNHDVYKITSDTTLIGAWAELATGNNNLEVGCGSGMISLMLAQRYPDIRIHAIDINPKAIELCDKNFKNSSWPDRLTTSCCRFQLGPEQKISQYDNIISNPPYHNSTTLPPSKLKANAKHDESLSFQHLISTSASLLKPTGSLHVIIPTDRTLEFIVIAKKSNLYPTQWCEMFPRITKPAKRTMLSLNREGSLKEPSQSIIMYAEEGHHHDFSNLLKPFLIIF